MMIALVLCAGLSVATDVETPTRGQAQRANAESPAQPQAAEPDRPPETAYDRRLRTRNLSGNEPEKTLAGQVLRTVLALALVTALIILFAKLALPRILQLTPVGGGKRLKVIERAQLDARHALVMVEVGGEHTLLLATGERGVQIIAREQASSGAGTWATAFDDALRDVQKRDSWASSDNEGA